MVDIGIRAGANTANVTGTIDGLFPSSDPGFPNVPKPCAGETDPGPCGPTGESFSVVLNAGTFSVAFDILPSANRFDVAAVGEAGGSIITIDPAAGTYTASIVTPTMEARVGDFSTSIRPLWDYVSCIWTSAVCLPFPNSVVPASRMSPYWDRAVQTLPLPNAPAPAGTTAGFLQASGSLNGSQFVIDDRAVSRFGGFVLAPCGPFPSRVSVFKLYVDGKLVSSKSLPYLVWYRGLAHYPDY